MRVLAAVRERMKKDFFGDGRSAAILRAAPRTIFLISISYIILFPLFYMISYALRPQTQILDPSVVWIPKSVTGENFSLAFRSMEYFKALFFTVRVHLVSGGIEVLSCSLAAYGFARFKFRENRFVFALVMLTILVPPQMIILSTYINFSHLDFLGILDLLRRVSGVDLRPNLLDRGWVFYLPSLFGVGIRSGLFIYIYTQFFKGLPGELEEAAWIDGAGPLKTFVRIVIPSSGPAILCVTIFSMIWHWNDYYLSLMYFNDRFPLSIALVQMKSRLSAIGYAVNSNLLNGINMAGCLLFILPMLLMYLFLQRFFLQSIERVGIVG